MDGLGRLGDRLVDRLGDGRPEEMNERAGGSSAMPKVLTSYVLHHVMSLVHTLGPPSRPGTAKEYDTKGKVLRLRAEH